MRYQPAQRRGVKIVNHKTWMWIAGLGAAYFFLTSRVPVFAKQTDGTYAPVGVLDRMTVALTGAQPPAPQVPLANQIIGALNTIYTT
jgi:hypothetical protein